MRPLALCSTVLLPLALVAAASGQGQVRVVDDDAENYGALISIDLGAAFELDTFQEWSQRAGNLPAIASDDLLFGSAVATLGDLDGNGAVDLAVGAEGDSQAALESGAVWIVLRGTDGSLATERVIRQGTSGFDGPADRFAHFGRALASLGDLDGNGVVDLAVGAHGPLGTGQVWILFLEADGSVASAQPIDGSNGGFTGTLNFGDEFGYSLAALGDLDGDGVTELAVGAPGTLQGGEDVGAAWILYLHSDGTVKGHRKFTHNWSGMTLDGSFTERMGSSVAAIGDLDQDGEMDLAVGAPWSDDGGTNLGSVWILFLRHDQSVREQQLLSSIDGGLGLTVETFGASMASLGDIDGDGNGDIAVGASSAGRGALYILRLAADGTVLVRTAIGRGMVGLGQQDWFGASIAALGDIDLDGRPDLVVGATRRDGITNPDFDTIAGAVAGSADGDVLLLKTGDYFGVDIDAKGLTLQAEADASVQVALPFEVRNLSAGQSVRLRGLELAPLELRNNAGLVWIEDCAVAAGTSATVPGLTIDSCSDVVLLTSSFAASLRRELPYPSDCQGERGVSATGGSSVQAYHCTFRGQDGWRCLSGGSAPEEGGPGLSSSAGDFVFLSGCFALGGRGATGLTSCAPGGPGLANAGQAVLLDNQILGGPGGVGSPVCADGPSTVGGPVQSLPGTAARVSLPSTVQEGQPFLLEFEGPRNALVLLQTGTAPSALYRPLLLGSQLVLPPVQNEFLGVTDGQGRLAISRVSGPLPVGLAHATLFLQVSYSEASPALGGHLRRVQRVLGAASLQLVLGGSP